MRLTFASNRYASDHRNHHPPIHCANASILRPGLFAISALIRRTAQRTKAVLSANLALVCALGVCGTVGHAATLTWDANGTTTGVTDGAGTWNTANTNWWNGSSTGTWVDNSDAVFGSGGAGGTVTISGFTPTVNSMTFGPIITTQYTLSSGTINLANTQTLITVLANPTISSVLAGEGKGLLRTGVGRLALSGSNTYTGATTAQGGGATPYFSLLGASGSILHTSALNISLGGNVILDNATNVNSNRLGDNASVNMDGGLLQNNLRASNNWAETTGTLNINSAANTINPNSQATTGFTSTLTFAGLSRSAGATVSFSGPGLGVDNRNQIKFTTAPSNTNGILGGWAIHLSSGAYNWATYDATNGVQALATYQTGTESSWASTDNVQLTNATVLTADRTINSLYFSGAVSLGAGSAGHRLTIGSGGILATSGSAMTLGNSSGNAGIVTAGTSGAVDLVVNNVSAGSLNLYLQVVDNTGGGSVSLVKSGVGTGVLHLYNSGNSYSGDTVVNQGTLMPRAAGAIPNGEGKGNLVVRTSGTLDMFGTNQTVNGLSGEGVVTIGTTGTSTLTVGANNTSSSFTGSLNNGSAGRVLALTKIGTGTLTFSGSSTYSGTTAVQAGAVRFTSLASGTTAQGLGSGSVVNLGVAAISSGEIDYFGATSGTFDKNVFALGNGRNRIRNSGGGALTLSGTLTKNGTILELAGGTFTVSGQITGASANSDLYVNGANVTLTNANNDYNGPTYVYGGGVLALGTNNVIPTGSVVTLGATGGGDTGTGTLSVGSFSDALGGLNFGSAGGTLRMTASATGATAQLTAATGTMALAGGTLDLTGSGTTAGLYRLLSAQSITGAFSGTTGLSAAYQLLTTGSTVNLQQRAVLGTVSVTNPTASIITGGSAAFAYTVANAALSGGASLTFTGTGLSNVAGSSLGSADAANTSNSISGLVFTGTSIGNAQQGTFTVDAPSAFGTTTSTGTVSVNVLDHALPGFVAAGITDAYTQPTLNINFGSIDQSAGMQSFTYSLTNLASQLYGADLTASLDFLSVTADGNGFASGLSTFNDLLASGTSSLFTFTFTPSGQGSFNKTFTLQFSDNRDLSGATATRDLTINAQVIVVPEPGTLAIAGIGIAAAGWVAHKRRRSL